MCDGCGCVYECAWDHNTVLVHLSLGNKSCIVLNTATFSFKSAIDVTLISKSTIQTFLHANLAHDDAPSYRNLAAEASAVQNMIVSTGQNPNTRRDGHT